MNDPDLQERVGMLLRSGQHLVAAHGTQPGQDIAEALAGLLAAIRALHARPDDPELGNVPSLEVLRAHLGLLVMSVMDALDAARALGCTPSQLAQSQDASVEVSRTGVDDLLRAIAARLDGVKSRIDALDATHHEATNFVQQAGLLNRYVPAMRVEIDLAKLHLAIGKVTVDFGNLTRAVEAMSEMTGDLVATVRSWAGLVSKSVSHIVEEVRNGVWKLLVAVRASTRVIRWRRLREVATEQAGADTREPSVAEPETVDVDVQWTSRLGHSVTFKVSAVMKVDPEHRRLYIARGSHAYRPWLESQARRELTVALFAADFTDLTPEYVNKMQERVKVALRNSAAGYGMQIEAFVASPDLPEIVRTKTMRFTTGRHQYQTRDGSIEVALEISLIGRFEKLDHITFFLRETGQAGKPPTELERRMNDVVTDAAAKIIRGTYADRYVLQFEPFIDVEGREVHLSGTNEHQPNYVSDAIRQSVRSALKRTMSFDCELGDIELIQRDDRIAELVRMILELRTFQITVNIASVDMSGIANPLPVRVTYQARGVDPQGILVLLRLDYMKERLHQDIEHQLTVWTEDALSALPGSTLRARDIPTKRLLREHVNKAVGSEIGKFFGIVVDALSIEVGLPPAETSALYTKARIDDPGYRQELRRRIARGDGSTIRFTHQDDSPIAGNNQNANEHDPPDSGDHNA